MRRTPSLSEALEAIEVVHDFLDSLKTLFPVDRAVRRTEDRPISSRVFPAAPEPANWRDRILRILEETGQPMLPKDITGDYLSRRWSVPERSNLGNIIRSNLHILKKAGVVEVRDGQYSIRRPA